MPKRTTEPAAPRKLLFPFDHLGKALFRFATTAVRLVKVPGTFLRLLPSELADETVPVHSDALIEFELDTTLRRWWRVASRITKALAHIEFVDKLRPGLATRLLRYVLAIKLKYGLCTLVRQCVVVIGRVSLKDRRRFVDCGVDSEGRDIRVPIFYGDELNFGQLSPEDQRLLLVKIFRIMYLDELDTAEVRQVVLEALAVESESEWLVHQLTLRAAAENREELQTVLLTVMKEEKMESNLTPTGRKRLQQLFGEWAERPINQPYIQRKYVRPARKAARAEGREEGRVEGHAEGREEGQHETHIRLLLHALRENDIWLTDGQKQQLHSLPCDKLPAISVAMRAKSANEFARKAGLNGSGPKS